jgi:hypothetical protein
MNRAHMRRADTVRAGVDAAISPMMNEHASIDLSWFECMYDDDTEAQARYAQYLARRRMSFSRAVT